MTSDATGQSPPEVYAGEGLVFLDGAGCSVTLTANQAIDLGERLMDEGAKLLGAEAAARLYRGS